MQGVLCRSKSHFLNTAPRACFSVYVREFDHEKIARDVALQLKRELAREKNRSNFAYGPRRCRPLVMNEEDSNSSSASDSPSPYAAAAEHGGGSSSSAKPPVRIQQSAFMVRMYYVNRAWKSVIAKLAVVTYLAVIFGIMFRASDPWYEFFYYLTLQGWTLELVYFMYSLYLDLLARWYGSADCISKVSKAAAQALSEVVFATQVVIVLFFWGVVYPQEPWRPILWELNCHGAGLVLIVGDYLYRFTGFSLRHNKYILAFAAGYSTLHIFVVVYLERQIYPGMDFKSLKSISIFLGGLSTVVFTHKIFYLISNWKWIKEDVKTLVGVAKVVLIRQNSFGMLVKGVPDFGTELLSISPRQSPLVAAPGTTATVTAAATKDQETRWQFPQGNNLRQRSSYRREAGASSDSPFSFPTS